jgi:opacity protein-like surface antigen
MKHLFSIALIVLALNFSSAQEVYLNVGRNFTTYDYTNSQGDSNPNVESSSGVSYEVGYIFPMGDKFGIAAGLTLDQFNATGGNMVNNYSWDTNYLGLQGMAKYKVLEGGRSPISLNLNAGINFNHIVGGEQKINGQTFKLTDEDEFKGLFIKPILGLDAQYFLLDNIAIGIGYHYSKNFGLSSGEQDLNFNNSQLQFGILMSLN